MEDREAAREEMKELLRMEGILIPASTMDIHDIMFEMKERFPGDFRHLTFERSCGNHHRSDILNDVLFSFHCFQYFERVDSKAKCYALKEGVRQQFMRSLSQGDIVFGLAVKNEYARIFKAVTGYDMERGGST